MRSRSSRTVAVALLYMILAGGRASAQDPRQRTRANPAELFAQLDADGDQAIDRGEVPEAGRDAFETLLRHGDSDDDGRLGGEELRALLERFRSLAPPAGPAEQARRFRAQDRNRDGALDRDEFPGAPPLFDRLDADGDGTLSPDEIRRAREAAGPDARPAPTPGSPARGRSEGRRVDT